MGVGPHQRPFYDPVPDWEQAAVLERLQGVGNASGRGQGRKPVIDTGPGLPLQVGVPSAVAPRIRTSFQAFLTWIRGHFDVVEELVAVPDGRQAHRVEIPLAAVLAGVLSMFWLKLGSIRGLDDRLKTSAGLRRVLGGTGWERPISDDTFADALQGADYKAIREVLHRQAKREIKRWRAGRYLECELAQRLDPLGCRSLVARIPVAIDGHELFCTENLRCDDCRTRKKKVKRNGKEIEVEERYHHVVVARWMGVHPAIVIDFEPVEPGGCELTAAYRLIKRVNEVYGKAVGGLTMDALYDCEPVRALARKAGYYTVVRHKDKRRDPGRTCKKTLDKRDPDRSDPDRVYKEIERRRRYECWQEVTPTGDRRYIEARRITRPKNPEKPPEVHQGACITDLPADKVPPIAVAMLMEERWSIESTFHELAGEYGLDRAFVHSGRPNAVWAIAGLAFLAYNALQTFVYRHLGIDPRKPHRTFGDILRDFLETLSVIRTRGAARARAP